MPILSQLLSGNHINHRSIVLFTIYPRYTNHSMKYLCQMNVKFHENKARAGFFLLSIRHRAPKQYCQHDMDSNLWFFIDWIVMLSCELHCRNNALCINSRQLYRAIRLILMSRKYFFFFFLFGEWVSQNHSMSLHAKIKNIIYDDDDDEALPGWSNADAEIRAAIKNTNYYDPKINNSIFDENLLACYISTIRLKCVYLVISCTISDSLFL